MTRNIALANAYRSDIDLVELRVDLLSVPEQQRLCGDARNVVEALSGLETILTVRRTRDGGAWDRSESERYELLRTLLAAGFAWIDIEADDDGLPERLELASQARTLGTRVIASRHFMDRVPGEIEHELARLSEIGDCAKIAATPLGVEDLRNMFSAARSHHAPHVILGMGSYGFPSRVMSHALGNLFTFTSAADTRQAASGHTTPDLLRNLYGHAACSDKTRYFAVIGNPVAHSKSPEYHNTRFRADGVDAVYVPVQVDDFASFLSFARELPLHGVSVTVPHKQAAAQSAAVVDEGVTATGACNTLIRLENGEYRGVNTDIEGFLRPIRDLLPTVSGATVVGAGGAARAAAYALMREGIPVLVCNRTLKRADALAAELNALFGQRESLIRAEAGPLPAEESDLGAYAGLIVQTTSVGMHPDTEGDPIPDYRFRGTEIVYDIIYTPPVTAVLRRAGAAGCRTVNGSGMFTAQAAAQYRLFTSTPARTRGDHGT